MDLMFCLPFGRIFSLQESRNNQLLYYLLWGPTVTYIYFKNIEENTSRTHCMPNAIDPCNIISLFVPRVILFKRNGPLSAHIDLESYRKSHHTPTLSFCRKKNSTQNRMKQIKIDFMCYYDCLPSQCETSAAVTNSAGDCE